MNVTLDLFLYGGIMNVILSLIILLRKLQNTLTKYGLIFHMNLGGKKTVKVTF